MELDVNAFLTKNFVYRPIKAIVIRFAENFLTRVKDEETKRVLAEMRDALLTHLDPYGIVLNTRTGEKHKKRAA